MMRTTQHTRRIIVAAWLCVSLVGIAARASPADALPPDPWQWPLNPAPTVLEAFDPPPEPWASGHRGVDLLAGPGAVVSSTADGRVVFVGTVVDRPVITIDHGNGVLSSFEPALATVAKGDQVEAGEPVAKVSSGGHCGSTCLHWGVRIDGEYVDPLDFIVDKRPSVLLPVPG